MDNDIQLDSNQDKLKHRALLQIMKLRRWRWYLVAPICPSDFETAGMTAAVHPAKEQHVPSNCHSTAIRHRISRTRFKKPRTKNGNKPKYRRAHYSMISRQGIITLRVYVHQIFGWNQTQFKQAGHGCVRYSYENGWTAF